MSIKKKIKKMIRNQINRVKYKYTNLSLNNSKKTIMLISPSSFNGGAPVLLLHIARKLKLKGYQLIFICMNYGELLPEFSKSCYIEVCTNRFRLEKTLFKYRKYNVELCICNSVESAIALPTIKKLGFKTKVLIHELPGAIHELHAENAAKLAAKECDTLIFPSNYVKDKFNALCKIDVDYLIKPQGLYLFTEKRSLADKDTSIAFVKQKCSISNASDIILNIASANYRKGFDIFVDLAKKDPSRTYIWVGYKNDRFTKQFVEIPSNLHLLNYITSEEELWKFYNAADLFVLTSREEPFGSVVLEAFYAGLPVAAFADRGGYVDVVIDGITGVLINEVNADSMLKDINLLFNDHRDLLANMSINCRDKAKEMNFDNYVEFLLR